MNNIEVQRPTMATAEALVALGVGRGAPLTRVAETISNITAPPFLAVPTIILLGVHADRMAESHNSVPSVLVALSFGVLLPIMIVLACIAIGIVDSVHIPRREQRIIPFSFSLLGYIVGYALLRAMEGPRILAAIMLAYAVNNAVVMLITFWWKISIHATGVGGPLAALTYTFGVFALPLFLLIPLVSWARVYLRAHSPAQVTAGACVGIGLTTLQFALFFPLIGLI